MIEYLVILFISMLPWIELRGAIPVAIILYGMNPVVAFGLAVVANIIVVPCVFLGLSLFYERFKDKPFLKKTVDRIRFRSGPRVERYGFWGLASFVAIPLPVTGAWTGTLLAWLLGMDKRKAFSAVTLGVVIAGVLVTILSVFAAEVLYVLGVSRPI